MREVGESIGNRGLFEQVTSVGRRGEQEVTSLAELKGSLLRKQL